ncbi:uncharacterized protein LOC119836373 [Zerene cesonia]|uniref:uncharacterized protein LOC119836373 n=1 Tax=Zerene cesonia TaxID=33412 RepID=UPI0018E51887|nr:uncharacterized protein LOC119836373 [Zerene cesonia]
MGTLLFFGVVALAYAQPKLDCPKDGHHYLVPDQTDCSRYHPCFHGRKLKAPMQCPPNTLFSFEQQACELAELVKCKVGPIAIEAFSCCNSRSGKCVCGPAPEEEDVVVEESEEEKDEGEVVWLPNGCPDPRNRTVDKLLPHPSCNMFYQCDNGELVERFCPNNTHFNYEIQRCEWAHLSNCTTGETPHPAPGPSPGDNGNNNCNGGLCPEGEIELLPNGCPKNYSYEMLLPHPNCEKFYQCVHGNLVEMPCAAGTHFSFELQRCEWPHIANCTPGTPEGEDDDCECDNEDECDNPGGAEGPDNGGGGGDGGGGDGGGDGGDGDGGSGDGGGGGGEEDCDCGPNEPVDNDKRCKEDCHVPFWKHETDCDKFWRCVGDKAVVGVCTEGLFFNEKKQSCDFSCNVDCERKVVQSTPQMDGLKIFLPWSEINTLVELSYAPNINNIITKHIKKAKQTRNKK